ncbi:MAG: sigma-70 family RNA polymerase sigma factor [Acidobacteria bacterium]|nr:sigma-70 family RNA polymerase sigma factor [Acidobacteriota bacterium]
MLRKVLEFLVPTPRGGDPVDPSGDVTGLLRRFTDGDAEAANRLVPLVYSELRRIASSMLSRERREHTLQPTALVNEAFLRLVDQRSVTWQNRAHFFAVSATLMRRVLVDHARAHRAEKRGGMETRVTLDDAHVGGRERDVDVVVLDLALDRLAQRDEAAARLVELRFFAGLTVREISEVLGRSEASIQRDWATTRSWLFRAMTEGVTP